MNFRFITLSFLVLFLAALTFAQTEPAVLATAAGRSFTADDLSPAARQFYEARKFIAPETRKQEFDLAINDILLEEEAKFRKTSVDDLVELEVGRKVPAPTEAQIKTVYDANREQLGGAALTEVRPRIVLFLRAEPEQKALESFITALKKKYKVVPGVDINSAGLKPSDTVLTVGTRKVTADWFEEKVKPEVYRNEMELYRRLNTSLEDAIYANLVLIEARNLKIGPEELIGREITDRMEQQTDAERNRLEALLRDRLAKKYDRKILLAEPEPPVQKISVDDDPAQGNPKAPVTIVMFSDFQCSVCSATHPVVKEVMQQYGDKVRLVVRDFPLPSVHVNAEKAAEAAAAANAQGKFFEYIEILYSNQKALDNASLKKYATQLGLDRVKFDAELDKGVYAAEIANDVKDGEFYGVRGTPTLFINGMPVPVNSVEVMKKLIDRALAQKPSPNQ
ncbi:MAG TPA: thioredoxin domain-containing protein [Pyrinomonadaceae bacterium]|jgi:protein-disulfide isomerase|nr:thioredoxin domain-containing protein [Pyrinomonadaceae bacterium]